MRVIAGRAELSAEAPTQVLGGVADLPELLGLARSPA
ncbi:hypothetical protein FHX44_11297 [Pseudonocardia hierapolitana]|uniref:Uncharacterized protein n=1 Tax=Pseudonocardia hierapolitana TaxID=1128676 RepID=A0A561SHT1_9PSEU|nr:hypothetical protein FHX44_11297 [Pseudonocardia hierapolitana]